MAMTDAEWLAATDPEPMLDSVRGRVSGRKLRLFFCACAARVVDLAPAKEARRALAAGEAYADGRIGEAELRAEDQACGVSTWRLKKEGWQGYQKSACFVAHAACRPLDSKVTIGVVRPGDAERAPDALTFWLRSARAARADAAIRQAGRAPIPPPPYLFDAPVPAAFQADLDAEAAWQSELLRDVVANPFRPAPAVDPAWLVWQGGVVARLARDAYDDRRLPEGTLDPGRLAVLADALEDAGCGDAEVLGHLRRPGPHVRGCWALDLILVRE
jgi:hypothetical protein